MNGQVGKRSSIPACIPAGCLPYRMREVSFAAYFLSDPFTGVAEAGALAPFQNFFAYHMTILY